MRFLKPVYLQLAGSGRHYVPSSDEFLRVVKRVQFRDDDFNITTFPPGASGESRLFKILQNSIEAPEGQQTEIFQTPFGALLVRSVNHQRSEIRATEAGTAAIDGVFAAPASAK